MLGATIRPPRVARRIAWPLVVFCLPGGLALIATAVREPPGEAPLALAAGLVAAAGMVAAGLVGIGLLRGVVWARTALWVATGLLALTIPVAAGSLDAVGVAIWAVPPLLFLLLCLAALRPSPVAVCPSPPQADEWLP